LNGDTPFGGVGEFRLQSLSGGVERHFGSSSDLPFDKQLADRAVKVATRAVDTFRDHVERVGKAFGNGALATGDAARQPDDRQVEPRHSEPQRSENDILAAQRGAEERRQQEKADRQPDGQEEARGVVVADHGRPHEAGLQQAPLHERAVGLVDQRHALLDGGDEVGPEAVARVVAQAGRLPSAADRQGIAGQAARHRPFVADHHGDAEHSQQNREEQHYEESIARVVDEPVRRRSVEVGSCLQNVHACLPAPQTRKLTMR